MSEITRTMRVTRNERYSRPAEGGGSEDRVRVYLQDVTPGAPGYERMLDVDPAEERLTGTEYTVTETYTEVAGG